MFMSTRLMRVADLGDLTNALNAGTRLISRINEEFGTAYRMSVPVGSMAGVIGVSAPWETPAAFQQARTAVLADPGMSAAIGVLGSMMSSVDDSLIEIVAVPAEPLEFATVTRARMHMPRVAEAIPFALEVADLVRDKIGRQIGVGSAITGDRSRVAWIGYNDDLTSMFADRALLEGDPEYLQMFKKSEGLYQDGSLEAAIWQNVA